MEKLADAEFDVHPLIRHRWSPRAFSDRSVTGAELRSMLEAARWAASCFNEQPWYFIAATREDSGEFDRMLECLVPTNQVWARRAGALLLSVARTAFSRSGKHNLHAVHDVGQAAAQLALQATALGLAVHQMAGFDRDLAQRVYAIPSNCEPVAAIAVGHPGDPQTLPDELRDRERASRTRRPQSEFVFCGTWGRVM